MCNVTVSRRVTHIVPTPAPMSHKYLAQIWLQIELFYSRLMLVLREKFILGNYICIRLKYPETHYLWEPLLETRDGWWHTMVSTHAMLITLSLSSQIPGTQCHKVPHSLKYISKRQHKSVFKLLSQQVWNLNLNAWCNTWKFASEREWGEEWEEE